MLLIGRDHTNRLLQELRSIFSVKHAVLLPQNRYGLHLGVKHLIDPKRPNVIISAYTIYDTVNMVVNAGGKPVFADIDADTYNISEKSIIKKIDQKTSVVVLVHLHGKLSDFSEVIKVCRKLNISVIEDFAQVLGAKVNGKFPELAADARVLSFGRAKNINAFFGGALLTNNTRLYNSIASEIERNSNESPWNLNKRIFQCAFFDILSHPLVFSIFTRQLIRVIRYLKPEAANSILATEKTPKIVALIPEKYKKRMTSLQAFLVLDQLQHVDQNTKSRIELAQHYLVSLRNVPGIKLPCESLAEPHIYLQFPIVIDDRQNFVNFADGLGCDIPIQHLKDLSQVSTFAAYKTDNPTAKAISDRIVLFPTYPGYPLKQANKNINAIKKFLLNEAKI